MRDELSEVLEAQEAALDPARPEAVARQRARGRWTARERVAALLDRGELVETGRLARSRREELAAPADGLVAGTGRVEGRDVAVLAYDYTVHAGTQSPVNHRKAARLLELAERHRWPVVCFAEGGGARPHEMTSGFGRITTFVRLAALSGRVPRLAVVPGRAFAGHANLAGLADVVIATENASLGMAGPPLVETATGERLTPEALGPVSVHERAGVVDRVCADEAEAVATARRLLAFFAGPGEAGTAPDGAPLRELVPESPRRAYDVRRVVEGIVDADSALELRPRFGRAVVTTLARLEGRPVGLVASQPLHGAGALDADASDKAARFVSLCDAFDLPLVFLCDTPGFLVGPRVEESALIRKSARLLVALANASVPVLTVVLRKAYGLGYYAMGSDAFAPDLLVAWPTAEFGGMGLEGAVEIVHARELAAAEGPEARAALRRERVEALRRRFRALALARGFELDDVIDPAETRPLLVRALARAGAPAPRAERKHTVDAW